MPSTFFNILNNLLPFFHVCLFWHQPEHVLWNKKPDLLKTVTAEAQAHPPKKLFKITGPPSIPVCTTEAQRHWLCVLFSLQGTSPKTKNIKKSWNLFLLGYKKQIPKHSSAEWHKTNWKTVQLPTNVWLEVILSPWEEISKKKNLRWLQLKSQPKTLTTASSEVSTKAQKGSKQTAAQHLLSVSFTHPSQSETAEE